MLGQGLCVAMAFYAVLQTTSCTFLTNLDSFEQVFTSLERSMAVHIDELYSDGSLEAVHTLRKRSPFFSEEPTYHNEESWRPFEAREANTQRFRLNIYGLRQVLSIENYPSVEIVARLPDGRYLGKADNGRALWVETTGLSEVIVRNEWTLSTTGCQCLTSDNQDCACCAPDSCTCSSTDGKACVPCNQLDLCYEHGFLSFDAAIAIPYPGSFYAKEHLNRHVLILTDKDYAYFYDYRNQSLERLELNKESMPISHDVVSLEYAESFSFEFGAIRKRKLLFFFSKSGKKNLCFEVSEIGSSKPFLRSILEWSQDGYGFEVIPTLTSDLLIGYLNGNMLHIQQLKANKTGHFKLKDLQAVELPNLLSWSSFKSREEVFLLLRSSMVIRLYNQNNGVFAFFQEIKLDVSVSAVEILVSFPMCGNKVAVLLASPKNLDFYVQTGEGNKFNKVWSKTFLNGNINPEQITSFSSNSSVYLILPTTSGMEFYEVLSSLGSNAPEDLKNIDQKIIKKFRRIQKEFEWQDSVLTEVYKQLKTSIAFGNKKIDTITIKSSATFESPVFTEKFKKGKSFDDTKTYDQKLNSIKSQIFEVESGIEKAEEYLKEVIPITGSGRLISGMKYFYGRKTQIELLRTRHSFIGRIIADPQLDLNIQKLVRKNDERLIKGVKTFKNNLHIGDLQAIEINGKETNRLVTTYQPVEIEGAKYLSGIEVLGDVLVGEHSKVDGTDLSRQVVRLHDDLRIGTCRFDNLDSLSGIELENDIVNAKPFSKLSRNIFNTNGDVVFPGSVMLSDLTVQEDLKAYTVMGVDFENLLTEVAYKNKNINMNSVRFKSNISCGMLSSTGSINHEVFPKDFIVNSQNSISFGTKTFDKINFGSLTVSGFIDSLNTSDIFTKSTPQEINGKKTFSQGIQVYGDLNIHSNLLDGIDISLLFADDESEDKKQTIVFGEKVTMAGLVVEGQTNGLDLQNLIDDLVYKDETTVEMTGAHFNFLKSLKVKESVSFDSINNFSMSSFVDTKNSHLIDSHKVFTKKVIFEDIFVNGLIDNSNVTDLLTNSLYLNKPNQVVFGEKLFVAVQTPKLFVEKSLNGLYLSKFLTKSSDQNMTANLLLRDVSLNKVNAKQVILGDSGLVNGHDFSSDIALFKKVSFLDKNVSVLGDVKVNYIKMFTLNNYRIKELHNLLLRNRGMQRASNNMAFQSLTIGGAVTSGSKINDHTRNLLELTKNSLKLKKKNIIYGETEWDEVLVDELNVGGLINGMNLKEVENDCVFPEVPSSLVIEGTKRFQHGFNVIGNLDSNLINKKNLRELLLSKTTPQNIFASYTFESVKAANLHVSSFNGINVNILKTMKKTPDYTIKGPKEFSGHVETINFEVDGFINGHNLQSSLNDAVKLDDSKIDIKGSKYFVQTPNYDNLVVVNLNGKNFENLVNTQKMNHANSSLDSLIVFGNVAVPQITVGNINFKGENTFLSPNTIRENFVVLDEREFYDSLTFENLVVKNDIQSRFVNGLLISKDLLTRNTDQVIWHPATVHSLETTDVSVGGKINDIVLPEKLYTENEPEKVIFGMVHFDFPITIQSDILVWGKVGHQKLSVPEDLVQLNVDSQVKGQLNFTSLIVSQMECLVKKLNDMSLSSLDSSLRSYRSLFNTEERAIKGPEKYVTILKNIYKKECKKISYLQTLLASNLIKPNGFDLIYIHDFSQNTFSYGKENYKTVSVNVSPAVIFRAFSATWMITSMDPSSCTAEVYSWDADMSKFKLNYTLESNLGHIIQWVVLEEKLDSVSLIAVSSENSDCGSSESSFWRAKRSDYELKRLHSFPYGDKALIEPYMESSKTFYIASNDKISMYEYDYGNPAEKEQLTGVNLDIIQWIRGEKDVAEPTLLVRVFDGHYVLISDATTTTSIPMSFYVEDLAVLKHNEDVVVVICSSHNTGEFTNYYIQASKFEDSKLQPLDWFQVQRRTRVYHLQFPREESSSYFALLEEFGVPKIYKLGGKPFITLVAEFPIQFNERIWIESFVDEKGNFKLIFGDVTKAVVVKLNMVGRRYEEDAMSCHR